MLDVRFAIKIAFVQESLKRKEQIHLNKAAGLDYKDVDSI